MNPYRQNNQPRVKVATQTEAQAVSVIVKAVVSVVLILSGLVLLLNIGAASGT